MQLKILLPFTIFAVSEAVRRIVVPTRAGSYGLLPRRRDCVAALAPGILSYTTGAGLDVHVAIDEGMLLKSGAEVRVCVRRAVGGADLGNLRKAVELEYRSVGASEKTMRATLAQLEGGFIRRFIEFQHV